MNPLSRPLVLYPFAAMTSPMQALGASLVHHWSSFHILVVTIISMLLASALGFRAGRRLPASDVGRGHFGAVQSALLGLLALLLGFTLNMAEQRFEGRRASMMNDAITLSALNLRADFLPEPSRTDFKRLLSHYLAVQIEVMSPKDEESAAQFDARAERAEVLHGSMCALVRKQLQCEHPAMGTAEMVAPLSEALAIHRRWVTEMETTVPESILVLLFATAVTAAGVVGYSGGMVAHRGVVQSILLAVFVSGIIFVIHDLDTPQDGISQLTPRPLVHLKTLIERELAPSQ